MSTKRAETYSEAAARRSFENLMMERAAQAKGRPGASELLAARQLTCPKGSVPGGFSAVAAGSTHFSHELQMFIDPQSLHPLPHAVLVHAGHDIRNRAVAVGVPTYVDGTVQVDAIFSSTARDAWERVQNGDVRSTSVFAFARQFHRGLNGRLIEGTLVAVDLVRSGADEKAHITRLVAGADLTPAQREVQRRLDRYLADPTSPRAIDLFSRADRDGVAALEPLRSIVAPLTEDWTEPSPVRRAPAPASSPVLTRTAKRLCGAALDGFSCEHPRGHTGMHFSETPTASNSRGTTCVAWDDRAVSGVGRRTDAFRASVA